MDTQLGSNKTKSRIQIYHTPKPMIFQHHVAKTIRKIWTSYNFQSFSDLALGLKALVMLCKNVVLNIPIIFNKHLLST